MWQRKNIEEHFLDEQTGSVLHAFVELIRVVAYNMSNGPWRGLWVRRASSALAHARTHARTHARAMVIAATSRAPVRAHSDTL